MNPNQPLLDEVERAGHWFRAKKTRPIWAMRLAEARAVMTLEGEEHVPAGTFLCRGEAGDVWPQTEQRLLAKYVATGETSSDGWAKYAPHPDNTGVLAAQINHPFEVHATWGLLKGKIGDYLVKNYDDRDVADPSDVWIVARTLFEATYERLGISNSQ